MSLTPGTRVGSYEVVALIGRGGMGEVYRARDARLKRDIALKILPPAVAQDRDRLARFTREAELLAALNHPNIASVYGIEDAVDESRTALVMELVDGEDLAERLSRGALPADEAVSIAKQMSDALEAAHDRGIVHRDLKPANIKVRADGTVKVLDFGLAKEIAPTGPQPDTSHSPTITLQGHSVAGVILGTAAYMAPETAKGRPADKRVDIWAFGVVLFEMLSGRQLFAGDSAMEILAAVVRAEIDWRKLPPSTPPAIRQLLERCLEPDPRLRLRDIGEARILLNAPRATPAPPTRAESGYRLAITIAVAAGVLVGVAAAAAWRFTRSPAPVAKQFEISTELPGPFALAPDGSAFAYLKSGHLYLRRFSSLEPQDVGEAPPAGNQVVLWSPDGKWIAYSGGGVLKRVPAAGGSPFVICSIPATGDAYSAAWLRDDTIVFTVWREHLYKVPATGGTPTRLLEMNAATEVDFHFVAPLRDGRLLIAPHRRAEGTTIFEILDGGKRKIFTDDATVQAITPTRDGRLLFLRTGANAGLWAAPFASDALDLSKATLIQSDAQSFSVADDGTLLIEVPDPITSTVAWMDASGRLMPIPGGAIALQRSGLAVSPDGTRAALIVGSRSAANVVVRDLRTGADTQLTSNRATDVKGTWMLQHPDWFPAGDRFVYSVGGVESAAKILEQRIDTAGAPRVLSEGIWGALSRDARTLFVINDVGGLGRLVKRPIAADGNVGDAEPLAPDLDVDDVAPSPDGRAAAIVFHGEAGRLEIALVALDGGARQRVTTTGGTQPHFSTDGRTLYFLAGATAADGRRTRHLARIPVTSTSPLQTGKPEATFASERLDISQYSMTRDDRLLVAVEDAARRSRTVLVQNWPALVSAR